VPSQFGGWSTFGPAGFLGIQPRTFRERTLNGDFSNTRATQVGYEPWATFNPDLRATQVNYDTWVTINPDLRATQVCLEVWVSSLPAEIYKAKLGPRGFLGVVPRTFRERVINDGTFPPSSASKRRVVSVRIL